MSNVTSQSELTTKEIVEQAISDYHATILPYLAKGNNGYSETPIGAMQMFDDDTAPSGWLVADGTVYDIDDYPFLANHIERVHGSKNYYGGNGTTTFAVPDWQGEFFRASGTNSHTNQGSGAAVGVHQDATEIGENWIGDGAGQFVVYKQNNNITNYNNQDSYASGAIGFQRPSVSSYTSDISDNRFFTPRPTNTSLLCCIKAVPSGINYSLEEHEVGTWIDGKPLYQKTISGTTTFDGSTAMATFDSTYDIKKLDVIMMSTSTGRQINPFWYSDVNYWNMWIDNNKLVGIGTANYYNGKDFVATIQYTKTTDV